jgi:hypothetical protein
MSEFLGLGPKRTTPYSITLFGWTHRVLSASNVPASPAAGVLGAQNPPTIGFFTSNANLVRQLPTSPNARNFINFAASQAKAQGGSTVGHAALSIGD